jgi:NADH pyrophosphatase NudC (nudix superfamily)
VIYLAAILIVIGVALFVAAPLFESARATRAGRSDLERNRLEHEKALAVQGLRELEFDREMHKLSDPDWAELKQQLEIRALRTMAAIEKLDKEMEGRGAPAVRRRVARGDAAAGTLQAVRFCPACGKPVTSQVNFCGECGAALTIRERA